MRARLRTIPLVLMFALTPAYAHARVQRDLLTVTGGSGQPTRWTLADWLRDVNGPALAASLLPLDRNSKFLQVVISAGGGTVRVNDGATGIGVRQTRDLRTVDADVYLSIFNVHGEYETIPNRREARALAVGLRVLGTGARTTSLTARFGWQSERDLYLDPVVTTARRYLEARAQLYLWSWFGGDGSYRLYEGDRGYRYEAGGFAELAAFRVFATYRREAVDKREQDGLNGGVKFFF